MILQALADYYKRLSENPNSNIAPEGFSKIKIPFVIVLNDEGNFVDLQTTQVITGKYKTATSFIVPQKVKKTNGILANLLWDPPGYVLGKSKIDPQKPLDKQKERTQAQFESFKERIKSTFPEENRDQGIQAVLHFLTKKNFQQIFSHPDWEEIEETSATLSFRLDTDDCLICQRPGVLTVLDKGQNQEAKANNLPVCLITGEKGVPAMTHSSIMFPGAQSSGANVVSFNLAPFKSYGKNQGENAPVCEKAVFAYTTALNSLVEKKSTQRIVIGDTTIVFWAKEQSDFELSVADIFGDFPKFEQNDDRLNETVQALYSAPQTGIPPVEDDSTPFFILGLAPNAARISVRFWHSGTVGAIAKRIKQHFEDCQIAHLDYQKDYLSIYKMVLAVTPQEKIENILSKMIKDLMNSILMGTPYPHILLTMAINQCRRSMMEKAVYHHQKVSGISYPCASLIKGILNRQARKTTSSEKEILMALDTTNENPGYLLGRLFAVLEKIQEEAQPGINATIRERFYGNASVTPAVSFPTLIKLTHHHIKKLSRGGRINKEKLMGEIMDKVAIFPRHLDSKDQGNFAVGYYQQRQDFFKNFKTIKKTNEKEI